MVIAKNRLLTIEEYLDYDDGTDSHDYELVDGVLVNMADEMPINTTIVTFLIIRFFQLGVSPYCLAAGHTIEMQSKRATARKPDLIVHSEKSSTATLQDRLLRLDQPVPRLVVEVASNSQKDKSSYRRDYVDKRKEYEQRGIPEYWIIDPIAESVVVLSLTDSAYQESTFRGDSRIVSAEFPELTLSASQILLVDDV
ncbi:Uma2 family endonuclease [cf. Phormidesmis sp. LEGE 11477]|uniref:Uma2 family endonuclease n=1 Tax=cf. Phormidesmis sp. LEGE 11477 TaxID=1828680 RepID=UPI00187FC64E|nr:Uma2 family endonuclease [cf. Phormidesmis sp. LEGE 11477]MBE9063999.1 Uma2 family endonuclease [cf. Phormidesmis sp. LEGE 11477]